MIRPRIIISTYDSFRNPYYRGGGAIAVHEVAKRLAKDFNITVLAGAYPGAQSADVDGVCYEYIGFRTGPKLGQLMFHLFVLWHAYARRGTYDLWVESFTPPFSTSLTPLVCDVPVIGLAHMLAARDMHRKYHLPFESVERFGLLRYRRVLAPSKAVQKAVLSANPDARVRVVPNGVTLPALKTREGTYVLYLGRIEANQKGLDVLLEAYQVISKKVSVPLIIAGGGSRKETLSCKARVRELGLESMVTFTGHVEGAKKDELLSGALVGVVPSRYESFSLTALEMLAYGLPAIFSDIEALEWVPEGAALRFASGDAQSLEEALQRALQDAALRCELSSRAREVGTRFTWDRTAAEYREHIEQALMLDEKSLVENIVARRRPCVFVSPHLDDAALSAGGLIAHLSKHTKVEVVNVFTQARKGPQTLSAKAFVGQCGYTDALELFESRRNEDLRAMRTLGIEPIDLGYTDALWRTIRNPGVLRRTFGRVLPEFLHIYPVYRLHINGRHVPSRHDKALAASLAAQLHDIVSQYEQAVVFCPLARHAHVDHALVRDVCVQEFNEVVCWLDFPYSERHEYEPERHEVRTAFVWEGVSEVKRALVAGYESQVRALFGSKEIVFPPERYYHPRAL